MCIWNDDGSAKEPTVAYDDLGNRIKVEPQCDGCGKCGDCYVEGLDD